MGNIMTSINCLNEGWWSAVWILHFDGNVTPSQTLSLHLSFLNLYAFRMEPQPKRQRIDESNHDPSENKVETSRDLYLDTINRHMLDFDFEKLCSVSLSPMNVYACLVCGKYYQGAYRYIYIRKHGFN